MTAYRFVTLTCDLCGEIWDGGAITSVRDARRGARLEGWRYDSRGNTCPQHNGWRRIGDNAWERRDDEWERR